MTSGGRPVGRLPYFVRRRGASPLNQLAFAAQGDMPTLTHLLGPAIDEGTGSAATRFMRAYSITRELIARLPATAAFRQTLHRGVTDTLAFQAAGFVTTVQFTHELAPSEEAELWRAMRDKTRNVIRRAQEQLQVRTSEDYAQFLAFYDKNLKKRQRSSYFYDFAAAHAVCEQALARGRGRILQARGENGRVHAAIFYVWDSQCGYYLMSSRDPAAHNGAVSLLIWEALRDCAARDLIFDLDGVGTEGSILLYAGFGAAVRPRFIIERNTPVFQATRGLVRLLRGSAPNTFT